MKTLKGADITKVEGHDIEPGMVVAEGVILHVEPHYTSRRRNRPTHFTLEVTSPTLLQVDYDEIILVLAKVHPDVLAAFRVALGVSA